MKAYFTFQNMIRYRKNANTYVFSNRGITNKMGKCGVVLGLFQR